MIQVDYTKQTHTRADELTDEEPVQEIMKRLLRKGGR